MVRKAPKRHWHQEDASRSSGKIRGKQSRKGPVVEEGGVDEVRVRTKCKTSLIYNRNLNLSKAQCDMIGASPFPFLLNIQKFDLSEPLLKELAARWVSKEGGFRIGDRVVKFSLYEMALLLGLRVKGHEVDVNLDSGDSKAHQLLREECGTSTVSYSDIDGAIEKFVGEGQEENFFLLYITLSFASILFPISNCGLHGNNLKLLDDRSKIGDYAWGKAVYDFLVDGLNCGSRKLNEKINRAHLYLKGCSLVLQIWALEHLALYGKLSPTNLAFPRFRNWDSKRLYLSSISAKFKSLQGDEWLKPTDQEELQHVVKEARDMMLAEFERGLDHTGNENNQQHPNWELICREQSSMLTEVLQANMALKKQLLQFRGAVESWDLVHVDSSAIAQAKGEIIRAIRAMENTIKVGERRHSGDKHREPERYVQGESAAVSTDKVVDMDAAEELGDDVNMALVTVACPEIENRNMDNGADVCGQHGRRGTNTDEAARGKDVFLKHEQMGPSEFGRNDIDDADNELNENSNVDKSIANIVDGIDYGNSCELAVHSVGESGSGVGDSDSVMVTPSRGTGLEGECIYEPLVSSVEIKKKKRHRFESHYIQNPLPLTIVCGKGKESDEDSGQPTAVGISEEERRS